jgi:hypothetical protein
MAILLGSVTDDEEHVPSDQGGQVGFQFKADVA